MAYVLFSPIGGTDPVSTYRDGSMLHIARKYHPEHIILFLSSEMVEREHRDHRYTECLKRLMARDSFSAEVECVERPGLREVQAFDPFLHEFEDQLTSLHERFPDYEILLNVSSGTPGMKSALFILSCMTKYRVLPIQVSTPVKRQNKHEDPQTYDWSAAWECNEDNDPKEFIDRCSVLSHTNLRAQIAKQNIKTHLRAYDYEAAWRIANSICELLDRKTIVLLEGARNRAQLNWQDMPPELKNELKISLDHPRRTNLVEYLLYLQTKQKRGDLSDFLRALTPALYCLLQLAVEENGGVKLSDYCKAGNDYIFREDLEKDEQGKAYIKYFEARGREFSKGFLSSSHYVNVIEDLFGDRAWADPLIQLREIEEKIRNLVAHTIRPVDEAWLQKQPIMNGKNSHRITQLLKQAVDGINKDKENVCGVKLHVLWNSYDEMNRIILDSMN